MSKRKTLTQWQDESNKIHNFEFEILDVPKSGQDLVRILHKKCGNIITSNLNNHTKRYCKYCSNKYTKSIEEYQAMSDEIFNGEFEILEQPISSKIKVKIRHYKCDNTFEMMINNHVNAKQGCPKCRINSRKNNQYWVEKCIEIWGNDYKILKDVKNVHQKVEILHVICNKTHMKNMNSFIHGKRGCPYCTKDIKYSENYISKYLESKSILFEREKTFDNLINPKTGRKLRFDFYLPKFNMIIETHGVQHYKPIDHWHGQIGFEEQIYRDELKMKYAKENNIKYIVLNNKELTKINQIV